MRAATVSDHLAAEIDNAKNHGFRREISEDAEIELGCAASIEIWLAVVPESSPRKL